MAALRFTFKGIILQIPFYLQHFNKHYVHVQGHQIIGPFYAAGDVAWWKKGSLRYGDCGLRLRLNMLLRMIKAT